MDQSQALQLGSKTEFDYDIKHETLDNVADEIVQESSRAKGKKDPTTGEDQNQKPRLSSRNDELGISDNASTYNDDIQELKIKSRIDTGQEYLTDTQRPSSKMEKQKMCDQTENSNPEENIDKEVLIDEEDLELHEFQRSRTPHSRLVSRQDSQEKSRRPATETLGKTRFKRLNVRIYSDRTCRLVSTG